MVFLPWTLYVPACCKLFTIIKFYFFINALNISNFWFNTMYRCYIYIYFFFFPFLFQMTLIPLSCAHIIVTPAQYMSGLGRLPYSPLGTHLAVTILHQVVTSISARYIQKTHLFICLAFVYLEWWAGVPCHFVLWCLFPMNCPNKIYPQ